MPTIHMYWTDQWRLENGSAIDYAKSAIEDALDQLNSRTSLSTDINISWEHSISGDWSSCDDYNEYRDELKSSIYRTNGHGYYLLYWNTIPDGTVLSGDGVAGVVTGGAPLDPWSDPIAVTNAGLQDIDIRVYKNIVVQELFHMFGVEHADGEQWNNWYGQENSPMVTAYAETFRGNNPKPDSLCGEASTDTCDFHNGKMSYCALNEAQSYLDYIY